MKSFLLTDEGRNYFTLNFVHSNTLDQSEIIGVLTEACERRIQSMEKFIEYLTFNNITIVQQTKFDAAGAQANPLHIGFHLEKAPFRSTAEFSACIISIDSGKNFMVASPKTPSGLMKISLGINKPVGAGKRLPTFKCTVRMDASEKFI